MAQNPRSFRMKWFSLPTLFLALVLATPQAVRAQELGDGHPPASAHVPGTNTATPLRLLDDPAPATPPQYVKEPRPTGERILAEIGLGVGVPFALGIATTAGVLLCNPASDSPQTKTCLTTVLVVMGPLAVIGMPLGVWLGGRLTGGRGYFVGALLGAVVGVGASAAAVYGASRLENSAGPLFLSALFALGAPLGGAIAGYEISASFDSPPDTDTDMSAGTVRLRPMLGALPGGAAMGLSGTF
ncbi:hypothetical protein JRI60_28165 [Archangium violaceum]|uniref:hypothetical protein n=1 Tax=Archangium violaceum TaxID=83451 RepID=UPI00194EFFA7|nr:hypothetical protein [Archangium violaceum]QRN93079.1 hypothetical protein JRI60_28165 [Archangium violaceum]